MKKMWMMTWVCLLLTAVLSVCCAQGAGHTHAAGEEWDRDQNEHWHLCECGEKMDAAEHIMDENFYTMCTVCGSDIWEYEGLFIDIQNYNEYGMPTRYTSLDGEGNLLNEYFYFYQYDEDGNLLHSATYCGELLVEENEYAPGIFDAYIVKMQRGYSEDGLQSINEYDGYGNLVRMLMYDGGEELFLEEITQYEYNEFGEVLFTHVRGSYADGTAYEHKSNEHGDDTLDAYYNADGTPEVVFEMEYEYDEEGCMLLKKTYYNGVLSEEIVYTVVDGEWGKESLEQMCTEYSEDGTKTIYEYNEYGDSVKTTGYDGQGVVEYEYYYEYEYNEYGEKLVEKTYEGERLISEAVYKIISTDYDYVYYMHMFTEYAEDGTVSVVELARNGDVISQKGYDAEGNEIVYIDEEE